MNDENRRLGPVVDFSGCPAPGRVIHAGRFTRLEPLDPLKHGGDLWRAVSEPGAETSWDYMPYGPFADRDAVRLHLEALAQSDDPLVFAIIDAGTGRARGYLSYMRITPAHGVIEIGHVWFSPSLQKTRLATEAVFLLMAHAFDDLGYRRLEWKCNALNVASRRAAERFGLVYEGTFRQHMVTRGRSRDSAWFAAIDRDWPALKRGFAGWLDPGNFDSNGREREKLADLRHILAMEE